MSYDIIRNDIEDLAKMAWNYCILDEGHIIKNGKTKITKAIKSIRADHRLILSGTPIQVCTDDLSLRNANHGLID
jgi:TATA-binding protein-associated factor